MKDWATTIKKDKYQLWIQIRICKLICQGHQRRWGKSSTLSLVNRNNTQDRGKVTSNNRRALDHSFLLSGQYSLWPLFLLDITRGPEIRSGRKWAGRTRVKKLWELWKNRNMSGEKFYFYSKLRTLPTNALGNPTNGFSLSSQSRRSKQASGTASSVMSSSRELKWTPLLFLRAAL